MPKRTFRSEVGAPIEVPSPLSTLSALTRLTERDGVVLLALASAGYMTTVQLVESIPFPSVSRAQHRLHILKEHGFIALASPGARGSMVPSWHLTKRGVRAVNLLGMQVPPRALEQGAVVLRAVLLASDVYAGLRKLGDLATWTLAPHHLQQGDAKPPRPWAELTIKGAPVALELDRPSRRAGDLGRLVEVWTAWRSAMHDPKPTVIYLCPTESREVQIKSMVSLPKWFIPTSASPRSLLGLGGH